MASCMAKVYCRDALSAHPFTGFAASGEAAAEAVGTRRFPIHGVSAYTPMCPEGTEGVLSAKEPSLG
jgi:hypothetical protein